MRDRIAFSVVLVLAWPLPALASEGLFAFILTAFFGSAFLCAVFISAPVKRLVLMETGPGPIQQLSWGRLFALGLLDFLLLAACILMLSALRSLNNLIAALVLYSILSGGMHFFLTRRAQAMRLRPMERLLRCWLASWVYVSLGVAGSVAYLIVSLVDF